MCFSDRSNGWSNSTLFYSDSSSCTFVTFINSLIIDVRIWQKLQVAWRGIHEVARIESLNRSKNSGERAVDTAYFCKMLRLNLSTALRDA